MTSVINSINPSTGKIIQEHRIHTHEQVLQIIDKAENQFQLWKQITIDKRADLFRSLAKLIRERKEELASMATKEMGKPIVQSRTELEKCASTLEYYADNASSFLSNLNIPIDGRKSFVTYQPLGVILAIMPWNFPYWQVIRAFTAIVFSGNVLLLKHASNVIGCAQLIEQVILEAGFPIGVFQNVIVPSSSVKSIIEHPAVQAISFTGSTKAGREVAALAAFHLKKQVLELGGSDAYVVLEDADIAHAAKVCLESRMINSGQSCVAAKRFVVVENRKAEFEVALMSLIPDLKFGNPFDEVNAVGPLARLDLRDELHYQVLQSVALGATLIHGGFIPKCEGSFYPPTILSNVKKGMPAYDDELFGPVAVIISAKDELEAIEMANDSVYGLGAVVFSKDKNKAEQIASSHLNAGNCFVNAAVHSHPQLPFGGIKQSGYGRELGVWGVHEFVNIKSVSIH